MIITRRSPISKKVHTMNLPVTYEQVDVYMSGASIQEAFPHLTPDEREFIKTGITAEEWNAMFGEDDEDDAGA